MRLALAQLNFTNPCYLSAGTEDSAHDIEQHRETLVRTLKGSIRIPLAVKLSPFYTALANVAARLNAAGADGLVLFNRFYQPDIDVDAQEVVANLRLSTSAELLLRLRWIAILSGPLRASLAASGGVHTALDGIKALLSGAHAVQMVAAVLQEGPQHFRTMEQGLGYWMARHQYESIDMFRGRLSLQQSRLLRAVELPSRAPDVDRLGLPSNRRTLRPPHLEATDSITISARNFSSGRNKSATAGGPA